MKANSFWLLQPRYALQSFWLLRQAQDDSQKGFSLLSSLKTKGCALALVLIQNRSPKQDLAPFLTYFVILSKAKDLQIFILLIFYKILIQKGRFLQSRNDKIWKPHPIKVNG